MKRRASTSAIYAPDPEREERRGLVQVEMTAAGQFRQDQVARGGHGDRDAHYGHPLSTIPTCCSHTHRPTTTSTLVPSARTMRTTRPTGLLGVPPLVAASGVGYGEGFAGNTHNFAPTGMMAAPFNAAARGDVEMILYLVAKGADPKAVNREGKTTADMLNGPVQRIQPWPEALALLEKLGAVNNHRCVSC